MRQAAIETVWRVARRARIPQFPISDNLSASIALVMADLSESQRETPMNLIFQRDIELTALTLEQLRAVPHHTQCHCSMPRSLVSRTLAGLASPGPEHS